MKRRDITWPLACAVAITAGVSRHSSAAGTIAAEFLRFPIGAIAGMSSAGGATVQDATALYWNPSGLAALESADVYMSHTSLPLTLRHDSAAAALPLHLGNHAGVVGYALQALTQNPLTRIDNQGNTTGSYSSLDMAHTLGWAAQWDDFRLGFSARYVRQSLDDVSGSAIAGNLGAQKAFGTRWDLGLAFMNFGQDLKLGSQKTALPRTERAGVSCHLLNRDLVVAGDVSHVQSIGARGHVGVQYRLYPARTDASEGAQRPGLSVRAGYTIGKRPDDAYSGAAWGMTLALKSLRMDFSYQPYGDLGTSLQFGLGYKF